ncbi:MAG: hypothetical protein M1570_16160 [Chloroflexi bacterium]|nr:hypothetical protein [Chloroflexota bacterium]
MTREDVLALCRKAGTVGAVKHDEFADYVVLLESQRKVGDDWQSVGHAYMAVDGKLAMANEDHRRQGKRLDFGEPQVLVNTDEQLTLLVTVTSEIYGTRHGISTSRKQGGTRAEREFPWEVAETSAIGRALTAMGYGLFPGAGLASAEDMIRAGATNRTGDGHDGQGNGNGASNGGSNGQNYVKENASSYVREGGDGERETVPVIRRTAPMSTNQRNKLIELYAERFGGSEQEIQQGLDAVFESGFRHPLEQATLAEASKVISQMIAQKNSGPRK